MRLAHSLSIAAVLVSSVQASELIELPDTLVICPETWHAALRPWLAHRRDQGHQVRVVSPPSDSGHLRATIRAAAMGGALRSVVLIGDAPTDAVPRSTAPIPTLREPTVVARRWGAPAYFASDFRYADLDADHVVDVAIARWPISDADELTRYVRRVVEYETVTRPGDWARRLEVVGGIGGFGPLVDGAVETAVRLLLQRSVPQEYRARVTYANWRSPFCPALDSFHDRAIGRYNDSCLVWVYAGHGQTQLLDQVGGRPVLDLPGVARLAPRYGVPIATLLSCYSGDFAAPEPCLAESMFRAPGGPIAIVASTGMSMPYGTTCLANALLHGAFGEGTHRFATLGEIFVNAQRGLAARAKAVGTTDAWIDQMAGLMGYDEAEQFAERHEHARLFHLLGDPLLRIPSPAKIDIDAPARIGAGETLHVRFDTPLVGDVRLELACQRGGIRHQRLTRQRRDLSNPSLQRRWDQEYLAASEERWCHQTITVEQAGDCQIDVTVPTAAHGFCQIRLVATPSAPTSINEPWRLQSESQATWAIGATDLFVVPLESNGNDRRHPTSNESENLP